MDEPKDTRKLIGLHDLFRAAIKARWIIAGTTIIVFFLLELAALRIFDKHKVSINFTIGTYPLFINDFSQVSNNSVSNIQSFEAEVRKECRNSITDNEYKLIKTETNSDGTTALTTITTNPTETADRLSRCLSKIIEIHNEKIAFYESISREFLDYKMAQSSRPKTISDRKLHYLSQLAKVATTLSEVSKPKSAKYFSMPRYITAIFSIMFTLIAWILIFTIRTQLRWLNHPGDGTL